MLSIGKLGRGQESYYLGKVAEGAEDYYSGEGEAEGYWLGDSAEDLGLQGKVDPDQLVGMLTGSDPSTGEPLGLRHVEGGPVPGFDLTFSAPKSVSLAWALGGSPVGAEVKAAHAEAVQAGLDYLQGAACWTRRGAGGHIFVKGSGFLAAGYVHRSSRAGDPQLHTHVLVANATYAEGRWTRLYHPAIYEHATAASYVYQAHLRDELTRRLGVRWREVLNGLSKIEGFDPEHLRAFSNRRTEILEAAGEGASARAMQVATLETREAKDRDLTTESLRDLWREKAAEIGLDREAIHATFGHERQAPEGRVAIAEVEAALTAHASHFDRRDAIKAVAGCLPAGAPGPEVVELADAYLATPGVIRIPETPRGERFTTRAIWELEQKAPAMRARCRSRPGTRPSASLPPRQEPTGAAAASLACTSSAKASCAAGTAAGRWCRGRAANAQAGSTKPISAKPANGTRTTARCRPPSAPISTARSSPTSPRSALTWRRPGSGSRRRVIESSPRPARF
jgi:conjugative relaxase-like TrwC/TraI family protein